MNDDTENNQQPVKTGWGVSASPFNGVKLELVLILIVGITFGLLIYNLLENDFLQVLALAAYGVLASVWLIARTRSLARVHHQASNQESGE